jgi:hypothetical protein
MNEGGLYWWGISLQGIPLRDLEGGLIYWGTQKMWFLKEMQNALWADLSLHRGPVGEPGWGTFVRTFERQEKCIWVPFLDPGVIKILSLGAIWNYGKGTGLS